MFLREAIFQHDRALCIVENGLKRVPRYGPLWFAALRLRGRAVDRQNPSQIIAVTQKTVSEAIKVVAPELWWKLYIVQAQLLQTNHAFRAARRVCARAAIHGPPHLKWKVWVAGARLESVAGNHQTVKKLLNQAMNDCPDKMRHQVNFVGRRIVSFRCTQLQFEQVFLECARHQQFAGNYDCASELLACVRDPACREWRVLLESALLWIRKGDYHTAAEKVEQSLRLHPGTGRLWALHIQVNFREKCSFVTSKLLVEKSSLERRTCICCCQESNYTGSPIQEKKIL